MTRGRYNLMRILLVASEIFGVAICLFWYPFSTAVNFGYIMPDAIVNTSQFYLVLAFYILASIPCFLIVHILMRMLKRIYRNEGQDDIFSTIKLCSNILLIDGILFLIGNIVLDILRLNTYSIIYYGLVAISLILYIIGRMYMRRISTTK